MQARALTFAALASGVFFTGFTGAHTPPVTTGYRIQQVTEQEVDLTAAGQGKQQRRNSSSLFVTIALLDSATGRVAHFVVDSAVGDSSTTPDIKASLDSLGARRTTPSSTTARWPPSRRCVTASPRPAPAHSSWL